MSNILKGNFTPAKPPTIEKEGEDLTGRFEQEALRRLGGSIAFVARKSFLYGAPPRKQGEEEKTPEEGENGER